MCTYTTIKAGMEGSGKGPGGQWFRVTEATVYFDHPVHALAEHTVNVDVTDPALGPGHRIALELSPDAARRLARAIDDALASAPAALTG
jgi:hypothetical protein